MPAGTTGAVGFFAVAVSTVAAALAPVLAQAGSGLVKNAKGIAGQDYPVHLVLASLVFLLGLIAIYKQWRSDQQRHEAYMAQVAEERRQDTKAHLETQEKLTEALTALKNAAEAGQKLDVEVKNALMGCEGAQAERFKQKGASQ